MSLRDAELILLGSFITVLDNSKVTIYRQAQSKRETYKYRKVNTDDDDDDDIHKSWKYTNLSV
jgi:hypothetical protein